MHSEETGFFDVLSFAITLELFKTDYHFELICDVSSLFTLLDHILLMKFTLSSTFVIEIWNSIEFTICFPPVERLFSYKNQVYKVHKEGNNSKTNDRFYEISQRGKNWLKFFTFDVWLFI